MKSEFRYHVLLQLNLVHLDSLKNCVRVILLIQFTVLVITRVARLEAEMFESDGLCSKLTQIDLNFAFWVRLTTILILKHFQWRCLLILKQVNITVLDWTQVLNVGMVYLASGEWSLKTCSLWVIFLTNFILPKLPRICHDVIMLIDIFLLKVTFVHFLGFVKCEFKGIRSLLQDCHAYLWLWVPRLSLKVVFFHTGSLRGSRHVTDLTETRQSRLSTLTAWILALIAGRFTVSHRVRFEHTWRTSCQLWHLFHQPASHISRGDGRWLNYPFGWGSR